jgi:hypothetical protein
MVRMERTGVLPVLSLKRCRTILGSEHELSDAQLVALRDELYALASAVLSASQAATPGRARSEPEPSHDRPGMTRTEVEPK